jgi:hypothetical protein
MPGSPGYPLRAAANGSAGGDRRRVDVHRLPDSPIADEDEGDRGGGERAEQDRRRRL